MSFAVRFAASAEADMLRLFDYLLERTETADDLLQAQDVLDALRVAVMSHLATSPWSYRKAGRPLFDTARTHRAGRGYRLRCLVRD